MLFLCRQTKNIRSEIPGKNFWFWHVWCHQ